MVPPCHKTTPKRNQLPRPPKVSVSVLPFRPNKPTLWFKQLEAQYTLARISTDGTHFNSVVTYPEPEYVEEVTDILQEEPKSDK